MQKLFTEFNPTTAAQWKEQLLKDLKLPDFDSLIWKTDSGIEIKPFYTKENLSSEKQPIFTHNDWNIGTIINVDDEKKANQTALNSLNRGVSCLCFCLDGNKNLSLLLKDIYIEHINIQFILNNDIDVFEKQLNDIISSRALKTQDLNIAINYDVLAHLTEHGNWLNSEEIDFNQFKKIINFSFNKTKIVVDASLYQNSGANQVTELAIILSHYNEYLNFLNESKFDFSTLKNGIQINVSIGSDFFGEIAKLRALRSLISLINQEYKIEAPLFISCTTSHLTLATKDVYTNLLRGTTQAMSAIIGGCNTLNIIPFDDTQNCENITLSQRLALNQQLILKEESYLNKTADISAGSYYIESLTDELGSKAFELFKTWETKGGFISCLKNGVIQQEITQQVSQLKEKAKSGELVMVGVNKYINPSEKTTDLKRKEEKESPKKIILPINSIQLSDLF